jgi:hypothetical protein
MTSQRQNIISRIRSAQRYEGLYKALLGLGLVLLSVAALVLLFSSLEYFFNFSSFIRGLLWYTILLVAGCGSIVFVVPNVLRAVGLVVSETLNTTAQRIGKHYDDVEDDLANILQLTSSDTSSDLVSSAFSIVDAKVRDKDFTVIVDKKQQQRLLLWRSSGAGAILAMMLIVPEIQTGFLRILNHNISFLPPAPYTLHIEAEPDTLMRGANAEIRVTARGIPPEQILIHVKDQTSQAYVPHTVSRGSEGSYRFVIQGMTTNAAVYASAIWLDSAVTTDTLSLCVIDRPLLRSFAGSVHPPSYTKLPAATLSVTAPDVTALVGSGVHVSISSNKLIREASVVIVRSDQNSGKHDTTKVPLRTQGLQASGMFRVSGNGSYSIRLTDFDGLTTNDPLTATIVALSDAYPMIALVEPKDNTSLSEQAILDIVTTISDDYGFSSLKLMYRLTNSKYAEPEKNFRSIDIAIPSKEIGQDVRYSWDLSKIGITPDDTYEYYLEVADNDVIGGPKKAKTSTMIVRMPSLDEVFANADKTQNDAQKEIKELVKDAENMRKEAEQLQREMQKQQSKQQQEVSWSDKKKAEDLLKKQQELESKMENVAQRLEQMTQNLQENKAISQETLQKYQELQKLMREVKSPELARMQEQMKQAMEQLSPEEMQKMMKDFKFSEEEFRKNLERQLNLLKRIQAEQKTDELAKRAEELARKQDELRQRAEQTNPKDKAENQRLAQEQRALSEELERLAQESKELEKLMKDLGQDMPSDKMQQAQQDLNAEQTQDQMDKAQQDLQKGDNESASAQQKQASSNLQRFAQQMKNMKREMRRNSQKESMRQMQKGINDLLDVSKNQEALREQMKSLDPNSSQYSQMAQRQQRAQEAMQNIANSMMQLGQKSMSVSPEMAQDLGNALQAMKDAMQSMSQRNSSQAMQSQSEAMSAMNSAAQKMSSALSQMMQGEGAGQGGSGSMPGQGQGRGAQSPFQRLQQLADQQQSINQGMQQMGQGSGSSDMQRRAELGRLAAQQGKAMKAIQELEEERKKIGGQRQPLGDLKQIAEEMKEVMSDMQSGSISSETRLRQERILSRLLDASRSMTERDYEKSRESNSGKDVVRTSPEDISLPTNKQQQSRTLLDQLKMGYTKDYESIIRQYYEALQRQRLQNGGRQ